MKLKDYIQKVGDAEAAEKFGVEVRTVESWRRGERSPRPAKAHEIVEATRGRVSFAECYPRGDEVA